MEFKKLKFVSFESDSNPLMSLSDTTQKAYIIKYLRGLGVGSVMTEAEYFDRDYLDEFSSFYSRSAQVYTNRCQRLHFFIGELREDDLEAASESSCDLQKRYLGFVVIRPIPVAPFGRTVLKLYPNQDNGCRLRVTTPARDYTVNIIGIELVVRGLAWQQQDTGVAACATICLWTMLHSSAYDDQHAIPTTAMITKSASIFGKRPFPSTSLTLQQITEAIHKQNLNSVIVEGNAYYSEASDKFIAFTRERFSSNLAGFVRSGYPVMITGYYKGSYMLGHAICAVGFREGSSEEKEQSISMADGDIEYVYIHDDNYGPNLRFSILEEDGCAILKSAPPKEGVGDPTFIPQTIVAAVHDDVKITVDELFNKAQASINFVNFIIDHFYEQNNQTLLKKEFGCRFVTVREYFGSELQSILHGPALFRARKALYERAPALSLHLGVARLGSSESLLVDFLYDTTDSGRNMPCFGAVVFDEVLYKILTEIISADELTVLGFPNVFIPAF